MNRNFTALSNKSGSLHLFSKEEHLSAIEEQIEGYGAGKPVENLSFCMQTVRIVV